MTSNTILWRRLDTPGHDSCIFFRVESGWRLEGTAVFRQQHLPVILAYQVECDASWGTRRGWVRGRLGATPVEFTFSVANHLWRLNDRAVAGLEGCRDLDLGFTPATNLLPIRRLALANGQSGDAPAAWFNVSEGTLTELPQRYEKRSDLAYGYEAPTLKYAAQLDVTPSGLVRRYPGLWEEDA
jgi:uncharacterized protein